MVKVANIIKEQEEAEANKSIFKDWKVLYAFASDQKSGLIRYLTDVEDKEDENSDAQWMEVERWHQFFDLSDKPNAVDSPCWVELGLKNCPHCKSTNPKIKMTKRMLIAPVLDLESEPVRIRIMHRSTHISTPMGYAFGRYVETGSVLGRNWLIKKVPNGKGGISYSMAGEDPSKSEYDGIFPVIPHAILLNTIIWIKAEALSIKLKLDPETSPLKAFLDAEKKSKKNGKGSKKSKGKVEEEEDLDSFGDIDDEE